MSMKAEKNGKPLVIGMGEVLWDLLPAGKQLGGAPANFAYHAHALGAEALVVSGVGHDPLGGELLSRLQGVGLRTDGITTDPSAPSCRQHLRLPCASSISTCASTSGPEKLSWNRWNWPM